MCFWLIVLIFLGTSAVCPDWVSADQITNHSSCRQHQIPALEAVKILTYQGAYSKARDELEVLLKKYPQIKEVHLAAARFYRSIGSPALAVQQYKQAVDLAPQGSEPFIGLAEICLANLDTKQAIVYANRALAIEPSSKEARQVLIGALLDAGKPEQAGRELSQVLAFQKKPCDPDFAYLAYRLNRQRGQLPYAKQFLDDAIRLRPERTQWLIDRADLYQSLGDYRGARHSLEKLVALEPRSVTGLYKLGIVLEIYCHDLEGAMQQYRKILTIDPEYVAAITGLERCRVKQNDVAGQLKLEFWKSLRQFKERLMPKHSVN